LTVFSVDDTSVYQVIAAGTSAVSNGLLGQFDPTILANGIYDLQLNATDNAGNTSTLDWNVSVAGHLKLGREQMPFTDLTIPVSGIPITVTRTYDSLTANQQGDFGYGWKLGFGDPHLQVDLAFGPGGSWSNYPPMRDGTRVYLTLPSGDRAGFTFQPIEARAFYADYWVSVRPTAFLTSMVKCLPKGGHYHGPRVSPKRTEGTRVAPPAQGVACQRPKCAAVLCTARVVGTELLRLAPGTGQAR
jgi:hypothetical protein